MVYLTRRERFNAAHRLHNSNWTEEKNQEVFGKCANKFYHGHNFELFVTVKGTPQPDTGYFINAHDLSVLLKQEVTDQLDHRNMNEEVDFLKDKIPTCENIVIAVWNKIESLINNENCQLHCIKLVETENIYVEYFG